MTTRGRAAVLVEPHQFDIREYPVPPVEPGGVRVKITAAGICGSDLHYWRGEMRPTAFDGRNGPMIQGHEMIGRVDTLGPDVATDSRGEPLREGDRVVFTYFFPCGRCYNCLRGQQNVCQRRWRYRQLVADYPYCNGGYADYFYLYPNVPVFKVPDGLPDEALTPVNCAVAQVIYAIEKGGVRSDDAVVIQGAGGLGLYAVAAAKERGAGLVIAVDGVASRLDMAKRCGADATIDIKDIPDPRERAARVRELCGARLGADVVIEVVGYPQVIQEGLDMLRRGGTYVEVGNIWPGSNVTLDMSKVLFSGHTIVPVPHYEPWVLPVALDFMFRTKDKYPLVDVVSHTFPLERINEAFDQSEWLGAVEDRKLTRAVLKM